MKIAILGSCGHWRLALDALSRVPAGHAWSAAPVDPGEDMSPVLRALAAADAAMEPFSDYRALLDREKPDAAVVNPPFHLIGRATRDCLESGVHVMAEKPLATAWDDLGEIARLSAAPGAPRLMAMFTMRYAPEFLAGYRFAAAGGLGRPVLLSAQKSYPLQGWEGGARPAFYRSRAAYGGTIPWIGSHAIDLFRWFSGSEFAEVAAAHTALGNHDHGEMESAAVLQFKLASGALASAQLDFLREPQAARGSLAADAGTTGVPGPGSWGDDRLRVAGDAGLLEIRSGRATAHTADRGAWELPTEPVRPLFTAFLDWVAKGEPMLLDTGDCLKAAEAALRARDAADQGKALGF